MDWDEKEALELGKIVTFVPNKKLPIYNWLYFKEGFSRDFVFMMLEKFNIKQGNLVLDPFCGSGTTLLACKEKGIDSIGFDVLPIAVFASRVKTRDYDIEKLKLHAKQLLKAKFKRLPIPKELLKFFSIYTLEDAIFFKNEIMKIEDLSTREFFLLALINASIKCSYIYKDGGSLKVRKKPVAPLRDMLRRQIYRMIKDLQLKHQKRDCKVIVDYGDARKLDIEDSCIDAIITSPPYLNKIEYTKVYAIEQELFLKEEMKRGISSIRSFIGQRIKPEIKLLEDAEKAINNEMKEKIEKLPQAIAYANDIYLAIKEMYRVAKENAKIAIVIGDGVFVEEEVVINASNLLNSIASYIGYEIKKTLVVNKRIFTTPERRKKGIIKEYILIWEKL
ncbi:MAG: DNA methyltransferase [Candidatus Aenigmatarchaeota archaeon]